MARQSNHQRMQQIYQAILEHPGFIAHHIQQLLEFQCNLLATMRN